MGTREIKGPLFITIIVVIVAIVGVLLWKSSGTPTPVIPADQDIRHPMGRGPSKLPVRPGAGAAVQPGAGQAPVGR
jgi:hypothetical protein